MTEDAGKRVKVSLTLEAIADTDELKPSEEDINAEVERMSAQFNMSADEIRAALGGTGVLENDIRMQKTIDFLVENAKISE